MKENILNLYKGYLIKIAQNNSNKDIREILKEVESFLKTSEGIKGLNDFEIYYRINKKPIDEVKHLGNKLWKAYDAVNPIANLEDF